MLQNFFTERELKGKLGTQRALQGHLDTGALKTFGHLASRDTRVLEGHSGNGAFKALEQHSDTLGNKVERHLCTRALVHLSTQGTRGTSQQKFETDKKFSSLPNLHSLLTDFCHN